MRPPRKSFASEGVGGGVGWGDGPEVGGWRLEVGGWRLAVGRWWLEGGGQAGGESPWAVCHRGSARPPIK
jgi:hypothetical protein